VELIKFLHVRGADIALPDHYGATPLHYAVQMCEHHHHHQQQHQQQQQQQTHRGEGEDSREMVACEEDDVDDDQLMRLNVLRAVLTRTEIIDSFDRQHRTPLLWAASCGILLHKFT